MLEDVLQVDCDEHGKNDAAVVCQHLLIEKLKPLGFIENSSEPGDYQGWCLDCEELFLEEDEMTEKFKKFNDMVIVCEECYLIIKQIHLQKS